MLWDNSTWSRFTKVFPDFQAFVKFLLLSDVEKYSQTPPVDWLCGSLGDVCVSVSKSELGVICVQF